MGKSINDVKNLISSIQSKGLINTIFNTSTIDVGAVEKYNTAITNGVSGQEALAKVSSKTNQATLNLIKSANGATVSTEALTAAQQASTIASRALSLGLKALSVAMNVGIALLIPIIINGIDKLITTKAELAEKAEEVTAKFKEQKDELSNNKAKFDELAQSYSKLSKGVNELGENLSLTDKEYKEYHNITNQIAEMFPSWVKGWDSQGNAILNVKGSVKELTTAYNEAAIAANNVILKDAKTVFDDFKNDMDENDESNFKGNEFTTGSYKALKNIINSDDLDSAILQYANTGTSAMVQIVQALKDAGLEQDKWESGFDFIKRACQENSTIVKSIVGDFEQKLETETQGMKSVASAYIDNALLGDYSSLGSSTQSIIKQIVSGFDSEFYKQFDTVDELYSYLSDILNGFKNATPEISKAISDLFTNTELSPGDKNKLIKQIQDYFGKDNPISIFLQPQFEENETTQKNIDDAIAEAQKNFSKDEIKKQLEGYNQDDTIDFTVRPVIDTSKLKDKGWDDVGEGTATVFSSTYYSEDFSLEEGKALVVTPILPDGTVLSPEDLNEYARKILNGEEVDVDIKMGMFDGENYKAEADEFANTIHELHEQYFDDNYVDWNKYFKDQSINTQEELDKWNEVTKGCNTATEAMQAWEKATADAGGEATAPLSDLEKVSDNISKISAAYKELSDNGYITIKTINELQTATGLSGDEWAEYENKLLNAKAGSAEFNQVMSDLTYKMIENQVGIDDLTNATDEELKAIEDKIAATLRENGVMYASAVTHDYVRMARVNEAIAAYDGTQASYDSASALISESLSADQAKIAMNRLEIAKRMVNSSQIKTASDIDEIITLANAAGASIQMLQDLARAKSELANGFMGPFSPSTQEILDGKYTPTFNELNPLDYKVSIPEYGSGSSSDKNDALDNYLEEAERRYKIHQDETKYINELDYALSNLVKTEEERRDVLDKIEQARKDYADNQVKDLEHQIEMAQNLKGENADVLDYYRQIQEIAHDEANRLRSIGYDDNSDEIQEWQNKWWDAQDKKLDFYNTQHEGIIRDIEHARDMALAKNPYEDTTSYYKQMQDEYHKMAEIYRSISPEKYKAEIQELQQAWQDAQSSIVDWRWENSQNWINLRNTYGDWDKYGDNEVNAWERVLKWLKTEFPNSLDKIREAEQSFYEAIKKERDDAVTAAEKFRSELEETYDVENKRYERLITREQGLLDIKTKSFDITNRLADAQHEADKAIADSRISKKYLTAEEYALIYNEEDYSKITGKIKEIATVAESLTKNFQNQIAEAYANGQDYLVEYITAEYERQLEMKERELEIAQAEVDLVKKKQQLENVLAEKNVRQMVEKDGKLQWDWVADTDKVRSATEEYSEAQYAIDKAEAERKQQNILNSMQQSIDVWNRSISANDSKLSELDDAITKLKNNVDTLNNPIIGFNAAVKSLEEQGVPSLSRALNDVLESFEDVTGNEYDKVTVPNGNIVKVQENGFAPKGLSSGTMVETAGGYYLITDVNKDGSYQSIRTHYAKGTNNTKSGSALMGENGFEAFIQKNGHLLPITQPTLFGNIDAGGKVFNAEQMRNLSTLWNMSQLKTPDYSSLVNKYSSANTDNSVTLNGDIVIQNPADFNEFTRKLTNAFRRKD